MSYLTQMAGLAFHNFVSAAAGIAVAIAVIRGFVRRTARTLGNFWVDLTRATLWVLLPISVVFALVLVWQGVPQNFSPYVHAKTVEGAEQVIAQGPVASQEIIKELGTNGGGFFNANSAHPYENPTPLTNLIEMLAIFAIAAGLTHTFGKMAGDRRQGWALFAAMALLFVMGAVVAIWAEQRGNPNIAALRPPVRPKAAATLKARKSASASSTRRCGPRLPPTPRAARSTRCTTVIRRWAVSSRCSTSRSAKSSSAASARGCSGCW